jgi:hypothetical protein
VSYCRCRYLRTGEANRKFDDATEEQEIKDLLLLLQEGGEVRGGCGHHSYAPRRGQVYHHHWAHPGPGLSAQVLNNIGITGTVRFKYVYGVCCGGGVSLVTHISTNDGADKGKIPFILKGQSNKIFYSGFFS